MRKVRYRDNNDFYYAASNEALKANYRRAGIPEDLLDDFNPDMLSAVKFAKAEAETYLEYRNQLHTNMTEIIECFLTGTKSLYASLHVSNLKYTYMYRWDPYGMHTRFRYGIETVTMQVWFTRFRSKERVYSLPTDSQKFEYHIGNEVISSFDFFGRLVWDEENKCIDAIPLYLTNIAVNR